MQEHSLYIGTNYHPHDWPEERWAADIALMKEAGFTTVRLGHLCWDSFEPEEGVYTFGWFDRVMDLCAEAGLGVVLDVSMRPAPLWVHRLCPGVNIVSAAGVTQPPLRRYMEDVADPEYQHYALRFARTLATRYREHPALFAFGLCNELGDGYFSFSETSRQRFIQWLKAKYGTIDALNHAWAAHRWSRRMNSFDDVAFPQTDLVQAQPEAMLDMRRFFSDGIGDFFTRLKETVEACAPGVPHTSNHYAEKAEPGFDYLKYCGAITDIPGVGIYPGPVYGRHDDANMTFYHHRLAETGKPMWCLEFQTGCKGLHHCRPGLNRMYHMLMLLYRSQMSLAWTWRSMYGGEEQFLYGLLDHDGEPNVNFEELRRTARDFRKLEQYAFPYLPQPALAVAWSRESDWQCRYAPQQYARTHAQAVQATVHALMGLNEDFNIVDLRSMRQAYRLLLIPSVSLMDECSARTIRSFVAEGGVALMTAQSAMVDSHSQAFTTPRPGLLEDVFGIRVAGFERPESGAMPAAIALEDGEVAIQPGLYEHLTLRTAQPWAAFDTGECAVSAQRYGKGLALYMAVEPEPELMRRLILCLTRMLNLPAPPDVPEGVCARRLAENQVFYVNTNDTPVRIATGRKGYGVLREAACDGIFVLEGWDAELVVSEA